MNAAIVLAGFVAFEAGLTQRWSGAVAAIVGGALCMAVGAFPYVRLMRMDSRRGPR